MMNPQPSLQTCRVLGLLLTYPSRELIASLGAFEEVLDREALLGAEHREAIALFLQELADTLLLDLQESYVALFDQTRSLSLHLFEHIHGDSGERGQAMADLKGIYEEHGLIADVVELPDYLPLFCEFVSTLPRAEARSMLGEMAGLLELLASRLAKRPSLYAPVLRALLSLTGCDDAAQSHADDAPVQSPSLPELDRDWKEAEVTFGAGDAMDDCNACPSSGRGAGRSEAAPVDDLLGNLTREGSSPC